MNKWRDTSRMACQEKRRPARHQSSKHRSLFGKRLRLESLSVRTCAFSLLVPVASDLSAIVFSEANVASSLNDDPIWAMYIGDAVSYRKASSPSLYDISFFLWQNRGLRFNRIPPLDSGRVHRCTDKFYFAAASEIWRKRFCGTDDL